MQDINVVYSVIVLKPNWDTQCSFDLIKLGHLSQKIERTLSDTKDIISELLGKVKRGQVLEISLEYLELVRKSERVSDQLRKLLEQENCSVEILRLFDLLLDIRTSPLALQPNFKRVLDARVSFLANRLVPKVRQRFNTETSKMGWPISTKRENDNIVLTKSFKEFFKRGLH